MHVVRDGSKLQISQLGPDFLLLDEADDFEGAGAVRDRRGRKAPRCHVEGHLPPVVDHGAEGEPDLAHDLRPHVKGLVRIFPFFIG